MFGSSPSVASPLPSSPAASSVVASSELQSSLLSSAVSSPAASGGGNAVFAGVLGYLHPATTVASSVRPSRTASHARTLACMRTPQVTGRLHPVRHNLVGTVLLHKSQQFLIWVSKPRHDVEAGGK